MDKVEELHRRLNHISDERLGQMLDAGQLLNAGDLTAKSVAANRKARGDCPDCQTGKFTERPRRPSQSPAPTATTGRAHADLIPMPAGGYLFLALDAFTKYGIALWQRTKSKAAGLLPQHCICRPTLQA